jgi:thermitase
MFIPARTYLLWGLGVISLLAGWQGVYASTVIPGDEFPSAVTGLRTAAPLPVPGPAQPARAEGDFPPSVTPPVPTSPGPEAGQPAAGLAWPLARIRAVPLAHAAAAAAATPVLVAVLDTGIDGDHPELAGKVVADMVFVEDAGSGDYYGHGTPVAGIIAAGIDGSGIEGLAPDSRLLNVKVADDRGRCRDTAVAEGIIWAVEHGARVINISIEMRDATPQLKEAVDYAWDLGAVIVAAAGNDGSAEPVYPAAYDNTLSVTGIRENGELAPLANHGDWVDVAAPGFDIYTTLPGGAFGYKHGTSFAAAYVSGLAARLFPLVADADGDGNLNDEVLQAILDGCQPTGLPGTGRGLIDVAGSLALAGRD